MMRVHTSQNPEPHAERPPPRPLGHYRGDLGHKVGDSLAMRVHHTQQNPKGPNDLGSARKKLKKRTRRGLCRET